MPLFWIVHETQSGERIVFISESSALIYARLEATKAGLPGEFVEALELDRTRGRKVAKKMRGRVLEGKELRELLKRME